MVSSQTGSGKTAFLAARAAHPDQQEAQADAQARAGIRPRQAAGQLRWRGAPKARPPQEPHQPRNFQPAVPGALVLCP